jgi:RNA polymerase sigma-70 factor (ECF subfamily)
VRRYPPAELFERFWSAVQGGDADALLRMMNEDVVLYADGGGKVRSALNPIYGSTNVSRFLMGVMKKGAAGLVPLAAEMNFQPGAIGLRDGLVESTVTFDVAY